MGRSLRYSDRLKGSPRGRTVGLVGSTAALVLVGSAGQWLFRRPVNVAATVLLAMLVATMPWVIRTWSLARAYEVYGADPAASVEAASSSDFSSYLLFRVQVRASLGDPAQYARVLQPVLAELVDDQLLRKHGIVRAARPERARAILGDELWSALADPASATALDVGGLERVLDRVEQL